LLVSKISLGMVKIIFIEEHNETIIMWIVIFTTFIFRLFPIEAAPLAHSISSLLCVSSGLVPIIVMCLMAATQASVTRTPLATVLILSLTASAQTELSVMLPGMILSSYLGVYFSSLLSKNSYFSYGW